MGATPLDGVTDVRDTGWLASPMPWAGPLLESKGPDAVAIGPISIRHNKAKGTSFLYVLVTAITL
jgi:hypothetical protein